MAQRIAGQPAQTVRQLSALGTQELASGGSVEKQAIDVDAAASGQTDLTHPADSSTMDLDLGTLPVHGCSAQREAGNRRDRGQRLATETQGADRVQIRHAGQFAGRVPLDRKHRVVPVHPAAVVGDPDPLPPSRAQLDLDRAGAGVQAVLHELLDDRGGPLHHFTRSDAVDQSVVEYPNPAQSGLL